MQQDKVNLLGLNQKAIEDFFISIGEKKFHARQVFKWIHKKGVIDFDAMTDLGKNLRHKLKEKAQITIPKVVFSKASKDGTHKWLIDVGGSAVETVFILEEGRGTLCVSSQVGCTLNCSFCSTGKQGFNRNLSAAEVIAQLWIAARTLSKTDGEHDFTVTNIVMMGMGEPLMNFENVVPAMDIMMDDLAYGLSRRKVTLSTSGVVPRIYDLLEQSGVSLAVSLHAPNDMLRNEIVPINKKYNIDELLEACKLYAQKGPHKHITFEYTLMEEVNDNLSDAEELVALLKSREVPAKINLIPFNPYPGTPYKKPSNNRIHRFKEFLQHNGFVTTVRKTRGDDIDAACGQLAGDVMDKTNRKQRYLKKLGDTNAN
ncbi:dual-specificity RNA methyltransferase RlmN [Francisella tularensis]|uniref:Dual-specificity RNA methyltransferase RlmN n=1 Tax=Francisella tularensis subsp. tularensis (strain WY96-3418) TaxID=418136 RepID=RLMN_FRATW|nr:bifunctional tRNA (adenosine(37)-C2)-methyltransferase TrmG/ribosomal RNA large subunit methyltransferase RlmN [Francisella tularensis]A4IY03.1 RecName: Full=Dual-specificity RNA methyltransferase RlmN; AltName: Full=23S rRNA (adenine(2503)-C(2))-methyltransferase; AltName: Full=23S rRNA m2A2503 methyltransferase; AltName: Full=Ribosomal RNA large subunit methyltransferase N; AltName: Full=tRNA (adenine(37)-C(2))-methyltransferase; AltName: Full=tRNA m2A37 methyltransferase [Francisella tularen